jgi:hypothetical protein
VRKTFAVLVIAVLALLTGCVSSGGGGVVPLPNDLQGKVSAGCDHYADFKKAYPDYRAQIIENREWIEELMPKVWEALVSIDKHAADYDTIVSLVCRVLSGDKSAQVDLDAQKVALQKRGVDWNEVLTNATKIALLFL